MNQSRSRWHHTDPAYDPVVDGVGRGLEGLFPLIDNPPREENAGEDGTPAFDEGGEQAEVSRGIRPARYS